MLNRRPQIATLLSSGSRLRSQTGRVLSGLGLAVSSPVVADAARKGERRADNQEPKDDDVGNNRDSVELSTKSETESDQRNDGRARAESHDSGARSDNSGKQERNESSDKNSESREQRATDGGTTRGESRRNADSDSDSSGTSAEDYDSQQHTGWRIWDFEQRAADPLTGAGPDVINATPANPNVVIDDIPTSPIADLVVDANDDVIATVSTSGGFAFARSGDVIAVTGPDGASIIRTGATGTSPTEPTGDGGNNNDVDFVS